MRTRNRLLIGAALGALVVSGVMIALGFVPLLGRATPCATSGAAFLAPVGLGSFTQVADAETQVPAFLSGNSSFMSTFRDMRWRGFVADIAFSYKYMSEGAAQASALNYPSSPLPLLPLVGQVVRDHPGVLEIYQSNWSFVDRAAAASYMTTIRHSQSFGSDAVVVHEIPLTLRDEAAAFAYVEGPDDGRHEHIVSISVQAGTTVLTLTVRGGAATSFSDARRLTDQALGLIDASCAVN